MKLVNSLKRLLSKSYSLLLRSFFLVGISSLSYIFLYLIIIPETTLYTPLNFIFNDCGSERCDFMKAKIPMEHISSHIMLKHGERYEFIVDMHLPECQSNFDVGMFVIEVLVENETPQDTVFISEKKSTLMRYKSPLIRSMSSILFFPLITLGLYDQSQVVTTSFLSNYEQKSYHYLSNVIVTVESKKLNFYEAHLRINVKLDGFRYFMCYYPMISFFIGTPLFFCPVTALLLSCNSYSHLLSSIKNGSKRVTQKRADTRNNDENDGSVSSETRSEELKNFEENSEDLNEISESAPNRRQNLNILNEVETLSSFS